MAPAGPPAGHHRARAPLALPSPDTQIHARPRSSPAPVTPESLPCHARHRPSLWGLQKSSSESGKLGH